MRSFLNRMPDPMPDVPAETVEPVRGWPPVLFWCACALAGLVLACGWGRFGAGGVVDLFEHYRPALVVLVPLRVGALLVATFALVAVVEHNDDTSGDDWS